ncbi:syntaxin-12-like isoform X2 [Oppia nitens]|uniref:syntaxin-12-like isoform X2 n=1 Tax=Oppia nitens TaxID=1686743 RepID=UPI0023DB60F3|nr:syntaxin-12-like isoform X2 [Oppia nitens]
MSHYKGYQSTLGGDERNEWSRLSQSVAANVQKISQNVNQMQRMVNQLGTSQDNESLRTNLHEVQHYTNQLARDTNNSLKELAQLPQPTNVSEQKQRRMLKERLTSDFSEALKNFQVIQRTAAQKEKESVIRARANSGLNSNNVWDDHSTKGASNLIDLQSPQSQTQIHMEEECDLELLRDREQQIRKIEGDIVEVNQIFKDLATMVHDQGEVIDSIEANVETASIQVHEGTAQLAKARDYQSKARRKTCLLSTILASVVLLILFILWLSR